MKMEKTPRYTQRERNMVLGFAAQFKDVIENKRTDAESNRKKDEVWRQIAKEFNSKVYHQRSSKQLRQLYKNMKLLLKKDLVGEDKGNRSFMDLLNTLSQQDTVAQYISEQMSPGDYSNQSHSHQHRQQKYEDDEYDNSKLPFDVSMDNDVIVIKSEDISDNEQSQNGMDDDEEDCLSPKDMPEVCLEEEDDELFATDLRQPTMLQQNQKQLQQQQTAAAQQPEVTIQNVGGIRVGSIGSLANLKALQNGNNPALTLNISNRQNGSPKQHSNNNNNSSNLRQSLAEQTQQQLLLSGLGLHPIQETSNSSPLPVLQRAPTAAHAHDNLNGHHNNNNSLNSALLLGLSNNNHHMAAHAQTHKNLLQQQQQNYQNSYAQATTHNSSSISALQQHHHANNSNNNKHHDYLRTLDIEERKRKIELLNAQIEYWHTLTKKLETNCAHNPNPACMCHFPGKLNTTLETQTNSS